MYRRRMKPFVVGLLAFALLIGPQSGFAHFSSHSDPDDTPGQRFDIRLVEMQPGRRADGTRVIFLDIWTWGSFTEGDFETRDHTRPFFVANLDTRANREIDFNVLMGANDRQGPLLPGSGQREACR